MKMGEFLRKYVSRRLLALSEGEIAALTTSMRQVGVGAPGGAVALAIFHHQSRREKLFLGDRVEGSARGGGAVSPQAHSSSSVETLERVLC